jgi:DNA-binding LacI/PurR family transcriptional regulator
VRATAVVCSNDLIAAGVILECQASGLRVPQDVSVTGYNDSALAGAFEPAITSVDTPVDLHAQEVARVLLAALRDKQPLPRAAAADAAACARQQRAGAAQQL